MRYSAVVGHADLKLALLLSAIDPGIGGVLLRGEKGSGKTTLVRALADLLPGDAPFVELPLGATEDRVIGSIDLAAALDGHGEQVRSGLLPAAHGGVLFVDEVNLLADHLVDVLLDVAVTGVHRLERDGISVTQPARFVLVGTMNPEEGELRPQLLDRFGLCVDVASPTDPTTRAEIVRRRLATDAPGDAPRHDTDEWARADAELQARLASARPAGVDAAVIDVASRLAVEVGAEGMRADLVLCRAAAALAGWEGRDAATAHDVARVAQFVLGHRRRRRPFDPPGFAAGELEEAIERARPPGPSPDDHAAADRSEDRERPDTGAGDQDDDEGGDGPGSDGGNDDAAGDQGTNDEAGDEGAGPGSARPVALGVERSAPRPAPTESAARRGRVVRSHPYEPGSGHPVNVVATVRALATRRLGDPAARPAAADLRVAEHVDRAGALVVVCLDTSGSMGARQRIEVATGTALGVLTNAYQRRDRVALVTFGGDGASTVLSPTTSVEVARLRLAGLRTGGTTPLADGLRLARSVVLDARRPGETAVLVLITDGRASGGPAAVEDALAVCDDIRRAGITPVVIDAEIGTPRLGLAHRLAERLGTVAEADQHLGAGS